VVSRILERPLDLLPEGWHTSVATTISVILAFTILSYFHVVMGEIVPKSFTLQHPERVALFAAGPISSFYVIFRPFIWVLVRSSAAVLRWFGVSASSGVTLVHSEEELKMLVTASREKGVLEEEEQEMLHKVFEFADKDAVDVMVPRPDVIAVPVDLPVQEVLRLVLSHPFTRYPVFEEEIDDIVGVLHVRDLFSALHERGLESTDLRTILREAIMVPETKPLDELLAEFQRTSNHLAIVVDEYGSVEGRRRDRRRVRPARRRRPAHRPRPGAAGGLVPDRRVQRAVRQEPAGRRLPHDRRLPVRRARPGAAGGRHGRLRRRPLRGERHRRPAHPRGRRDADRGGAPAGPPSGAGRVSRRRSAPEGV
jgi:hypothetical protein